MPQPPSTSPLRPARIAGIVPRYLPDSDKLQVTWELEISATAPTPLHLRLIIENETGDEITRDQFVNVRPAGHRNMPLRGLCEIGTSPSPAKYRLRVELAHRRQRLDTTTLPLELVGVQ